MAQNLVDYTKAPATAGGKGNLGPVFTGTGNAKDVAASPIAGTGTELAVEVVKATFDKAMAWKARIEPMYRSFAEIRPGSLVHPGTGVDMFRMHKDLDVVDTPLDEYSDPDAVPLTAPEKITLVANEYGNATVTTLRLREYSWADIDPIQIELVARNMRDSIDSLYRKAIYADKGGFPSSGTTANAGEGFLQYKPGTATALGNGVKGTAADLAGTTALTAAHVRRIVANFRNRNVMPYSNGLYLGLVTPDVAVNLREETAVSGWRYPHLDGSQSGPIWQNTVGVFEGVSFLESPVYKGLSGDGSKDVTTGSANVLFLGRDGLAETVIREPGAVVLPQVDRFNRFMGVGWYAFLGAGIYNADAGVKVLVTAA